MVRSSCCDWNTSKDRSILCWRGVTSAQTYQQTWAWNRRKKATKQCNHSALLFFGCTYFCCVYFPTSLPCWLSFVNLCWLSFVNVWFKSEDLNADFSMHFVNVFLNWSCPYILAQGGVLVSVFGTTVLFLCICPTLSSLSSSTFCMHSTVCQSVCRQHTHCV